METPGDGNQTQNQACGMHENPGGIREGRGSRGYETHRVKLVPSKMETSPVRRR